MYMNKVVPVDGIIWSLFCATRRVVGHENTWRWMV